jgi:hypothetical protein
LSTEISAALTSSFTGNSETIGQLIPNLKPNPTTPGGGSPALSEMSLFEGDRTGSEHARCGKDVRTQRLWGWSAMGPEQLDELDLRDGVKEVDLRDRLRFAAGSLVADFAEALSLAHAEALVFSSADVLLASASVTDFVPILAERRARLAIRSAAPPAAAAPAAPPPAPAAPPARAPQRAPGPPAGPAVPPLMSVPESQLARLRETLEQAQTRVAVWRAERDRG